MFIFEALRAKHGDSLLIHAGDPNEPKLIVIDGGPPGVWTDALKERLAQLHDERNLPDNKPLPIELMMVSHIDEDHIAGLLELMMEQKQRDENKDPLLFNIKRFWHNSFDDVIGDADGATAGSASLAASLAAVASVAQGRDLRKLIERFKLDKNKPFGGLVQLGGAVKDADVAGVKFTVIGPSTENIDALRKKWDTEIKPILKKEKAGDHAEATAFVDKSVPNLSSLVLLAEMGGKRILLTGDGRGDHALKGLETAGFLQAPDGKMEIDILKLPHHGSVRDVALEYFQRIRAKHYVASADGRFDNPDLATLKLISKARPDDDFTLHLTNPTDEFVKEGIGEAIAAFFDQEKADGRKYKVVQRKSDDLSISIDLS